MKKIKQQKNTGMATIELLIAFAILLINITGVILLLNTGQNVSLDSEINQEMLRLAQKQIEDTQTESKKNFFSIESSSSTETSEGLSFQKILSVYDLTPCKKEAISSIAWATTNDRPQEIKLSTFLTDTVEAIALGSDCPLSPPGGDDWKKPKFLNYSDVNLKTDGYGKSIDVRNNKVYLITKAAGNNKDDFYVFDTTNPDSPIKLTHLDISDGLEDLDLTDNFAFIANDENKDFNQLVVVDINNPLNPPIFVNLPGTNGSCPNTCPGGRSIYFYKDRVYLGTHRMTAVGAAEFHVLDVSNPTSPAWMGSKGGVALGDITDHNINDIVVREQIVSGIKRTYAFLATSSNSGELIILNVTNPGSIPTPANTSATGSILNLPGINSTGENLDATAISIIGNKAYIGRERAANISNKDFYIVDIKNPGSPSVVGSYNLGMNSSGSSVVGVKVISNLAFIATTDPNNPFIVLDISNPSNIVPWVASGCGINFSTYPTGIDYDNNMIYLPLNNGNANINLKIIKPTGGSC